MRPERRCATSVELVVHGIASCEDTAITRDRLRALGVDYRYVDLEADPDALAWVKAQHGGARVTPTLRLGEGSGAAIVAEPTMERLEELLAAAGQVVPAIRAVELHGRAIERRLPSLTLARPESAPWRVEDLGPRLAPILAFLHGPTCLVCQGWAHQVAARADELAALDAKAVFVLPAPVAEIRAWRDELGPGALVVGDPERRWARVVGGRLGHVGAEVDGRPEVFLVVADRYRAPRAWIADRDAGGLIGGDEIVAWAGLLLAECPECGGEVAWPEPAPEATVKP